MKKLAEKWHKTVKNLFPTNGQHQLLLEPTHLKMRRLAIVGVIFFTADWILWEVTNYVIVAPLWAIVGAIVCAVMIEASYALRRDHAKIITTLEHQYRLKHRGKSTLNKWSAPKTNLLQTALTTIRASSAVAAMDIVSDGSMELMAPMVTSMIQGIPQMSLDKVALCCDLLQDSTFNKDEARQIVELAEAVRRRFPEHERLQELMNLLLKEFS